MQTLLQHSTDGVRTAAAHTHHFDASSHFSFFFHQELKIVCHISSPFTLRFLNLSTYLGCRTGDSGRGAFPVALQLKTA